MKRYDPLVAPDPKEWLALDEEERIELVRDYHRRKRIKLPNDKVHAIAHAVIESQIAEGDALPAERSLRRLMAQRLDRHEAIHALGTVLSDHLFLIFRNEAGEDPNPAYFAAMERITAEEWRKQSVTSVEDYRDATDIIHGLASGAGLPVTAIEAAREQRSSVVPAFIAAIERYLTDDLDAPDRHALFFMFHLLGEWREKAAYRPLAEFLRRPGEEIQDILGDATTATSHRVMAAVFDGDPQPLYDVILDPEANAFVRSRMCEAIAMVTLEGKLPRAEAARLLHACYSDIEPQEESYVWLGWQSAIALLGLAELEPLVEQAFKRGLIDKYFAQPEEFEEDLQQAIGHSGSPAKLAGEYAPFDDTIEELSYWGDLYSKEEISIDDPFENEGLDDEDSDDEFEHEEFEQAAGDEYSDARGRNPLRSSVPAINPFKAVGRNDPCPCGSGKK